MNIPSFITGGACFLAILFVGYEGIHALQSNSHYISTNGISERHVVSNEASWSIELVAESDSVKECQDKMTQNVAALLDFLKKCGFDDKSISQNPAVIVDNIYWKNSSNPISRFSLKKSVTVRTTDIDLVSKSRTKLSELLEKNIVISEEAVNYYYKDLETLRVEMIQEAARDSQNRAKIIAESVNAKVSGIKNLTTGNFAIFAEDTPILQEEEWNEGRKSIKKRVRVVVHGTFNLK